MDQPGNEGDGGPTIEAHGLRAPEGMTLGAIEGRVGWTRRRLALQGVGLLLGLSLLGWAISLAAGESNRASWQAMRHAPAGLAFGLVGLSVVGVVLNGLLFWITLRPLHRLRPFEVIGVNAIATFLSALPMKMGLATRALIHHRRDGVRLRVMVAWVAAMGALALATLAPLGFAGLWRGRLDGLWWATAIGGAALCNALGVALGRAAQRRPWLARLSMGSWEIVRHPTVVLAHLALRLADVAVLAGRFAFAAAIAHVPIENGQAMLIATTYFLLSVTAPAGTLGFREAGVAAVAMMQGLDERALALVALTVSVAEFAAGALLAAPAVIALRPDRLLRRGWKPG